MKQILLIADGDSELSELYRQLLTQRGYEVETASDGLDCLKKLRQVTPDALVLDLALPWGGGDGVLDWIRDVIPSHAIPVILTATAGFSLDLAEFRMPPVVGYLPKPFALTALLESVRSAFAKQGRRETSNLQPVPALSGLFVG